MRRAARTDENQASIVAGLRAFGASVQPLHAVGQGCPDLLVGYRGRNYLIEVKNPEKPKADQQLTPRQVEWHGAWVGDVHTVRTLDGAIEFILDKGKY